MGFKSEKQRKGFFGMKYGGNKGSNIKLNPTSPSVKSKVNIILSRSESKGIKNKWVLQRTRKNKESGTLIPIATPSKTKEEALKKLKIFKKTKKFVNNNQDSDGDGVPDHKDCKPFDPKKQGKIHELFKKIKNIKKEETAEEQAEKLQQLRKDRIKAEGLANIDKKIQEERAKKEKAEKIIKESKQKEFEHSKLGKTFGFLKDQEKKLHSKIKKKLKTTKRHKRKKCKKVKGKCKKPKIKSKKHKVKHRKTKHKRKSTKRRSSKKPQIIKVVVN